KNNIYLIGGTIPEKDDNKIYNTCFIFDKNGNIVSKYRKMHLFDIDIPKKIRFLESDVLTAGSDLTLIDTEICKIGIAICYDMRFSEIFRIMALAGAQIILAPASFNMITGPLHWELLIKSRALDNQIFFGACSTARSNKSEYVSYGNSMICDPWANIVAKGGFGEEIIYGEIDLSKNLKYRSELPLIKHRRKDLYSIKYKSTGIY
ncbi:MAG: carbon-nitrogen hydrolase family protein, partial [Clostridiales bacterium]